MSGLSDAEREALVDLIDRHEYDVALTGSIRPACACGWIADLDWLSVRVHSEHVAEQVERILAARLAEQAERIAQAIEALPGPDDVGIKRWPSADQEAYLLAIEEAASIARNHGATP